PPTLYPAPCYPRIVLRSSTERRRRRRKMATMIASPTATSAAATAITKKTIAWPSAEPSRWPKATNARFAALSINSIDMKITSGSRRTMTPTTPMANSTADSPTYQECGANRSALVPTGQQHDADHGGEQEHRGHLERKQVIREQQPRDRVHAVRRGRA